MGYSIPELKGVRFKRCGAQCHGDGTKKLAERQEKRDDRETPLSGKKRNGDEKTAQEGEEEPPRG